MKKLRKSICLLFVASMLFGKGNAPIYATETRYEASSGENKGETNGFNENAHGEVVEEGECGNLGDNLKYTIYKDGTLYIYGKGDMRNYISESVFSKRSNIKNLYIENGVSSIGNYSFWCCIGLKKAKIPYGIKNIGEQAFFNCVDLEEIWIPDSVNTIGKACFSDCKMLKEIKIPKLVKEIKEYTFHGCEKINKILLTEEVKKIGDSAFEKCKNLSLVELPGNLEYLGGQCFFGCSNLKEIKIPNGINEIGRLMFGGCAKLKEIRIPNGVKKISNISFSGCANLERIEIPDSVTMIYDDAFDYCDMLTIYCSKGSYAENFADINNIPFKITHIHKYESTIIKEPTCKECGIKKYECSECEHRYERTIPKTGHKYRKWKVYKKPTIFKNGAEKKSCTTCGNTFQTREIKKLKATVKIYKTKLNLKKGKLYQLKIKKKSNGDKISKWSTSNKKIVSVNKKTGKIKALKKGKATITVKMKSGCKATCKVTVK